MLHGLLEEAALGTEAGVGEEDVHSPEGVHGALHERLLLLPARHVAAHGDGLLVTAQLVGQHLEAVERARGQHRAVAELHRPAGGGGADTRTGAGDDQDRFVGHGAWF